MERQALEKILSPISISQFFEKHYEKNMLHISRNDVSYYNDILTSQEISSFLYRQDIFYPSLRIVKNGQEIPAGQYTLKGVPIGHHKRDGLIQTEKAFKLFNAGSTLVIQAGQRYFDHLSKCCVSLSEKFKSPVQANLYITPNKSVGFNPHWDTHDVFVLQISGTKTWHLYGFEKELPVKGQTFVNKGYSKEPLQTIQIQPGDFLYVPRGYVHDAVADNGISAHITIGILSYTWIRFFNEALLQLANDKAFREAVPLWENNLEEKIQEKVALLKDRLDNIDYAAPINNLNRHHIATQPQPVNRYFDSLLKLDSLNPQQPLAINKSVIVQQTSDGENLILEFLGKKVTVPIHSKHVLEKMMEKNAFTMADFENEIDEHLIRQLVREGMIYFAD